MTAVRKILSFIFLFEIGGVWTSGHLGVVPWMGQMRLSKNRPQVLARGVLQHQFGRRTDPVSSCGLLSSQSVRELFFFLRNRRRPSHASISPDERLAFRFGFYVIRRTLVLRA